MCWRHVLLASQIRSQERPKYITFVEVLPKDDDGSVDREKVKSEHGVR